MDAVEANIILDRLFQGDGRKSPDGNCYIFNDCFDGFVIHGEKCPSVGLAWTDGSRCINKSTWRGVWPSWVDKPSK